MKPTLYVTCECSQRREVTPAQCGTSVKCFCGRSLNVPRLSELKRQCGQSNLTTIEQARLQASQDQDGATRQCAACDLRAGVTTYCTIQCESTVTKGSGFMGNFVLMWINLIGGLMASRNYSNPEVHGRNTAIRIPIAICEDCMTTFAKSDTMRKTVLRKTTTYKQVLAEYPDAITVVTSPKT